MLVAFAVLVREHAFSKGSLKPCTCSHQFDFNEILWPACLKKKRFSLLLAFKLQRIEEKLVTGQISIVKHSLNETSTWHAGLKEIDIATRNPFAVLVSSLHVFVFTLWPFNNPLFLAL